MIDNTVEFQAKNTNIERYSRYADIATIKKEAKQLNTQRVLHINSVSSGGGVSAILSRIIPVFKDLDITTHWYVSDVGTRNFFAITKKQHNQLQGIEKGILTESEKKLYKIIQEKAASKIERYIDNYDIVVIHDTQYLGIIKYLKRKNAKWIYRCHIDTTSPNKDVVNFFMPLIQLYDATIYHLDEFVIPGSPHPFVMPPSIDPFEKKNDINAVSNEFIKKTVESMGVSFDKPILLQVGRFDPAKGFELVCDVFKRVKKEVDDIQLLLTGAGSKDDPEFISYIDIIRKEVKNIKDAVVKELPFDVLKLNAVQQASTVVYALSKKEGFGLVASEAAIKKKPIIVSNVGGLPLQVKNGKTGFIINSIDEAVEKTILLLKNPDLRKRMGEEGRRYIISKFITPIHIKNYLEIFKSALGDDDL